LVFYFMQSR